MENSNSGIRLSICIPTYNRAGFIKETLENIACQAGDNVEIVIVDGASSDNTAETVDRFKQRFKNIAYYRSEKNMGVDRDMARTIELAHGEYCWLLSDDDMLKPGAIEMVLKEIESKYEIYLCNVTVCDRSMRPLRDRFWLSAGIKDRVFNLHNRDELIKYCDKANSIGALFSYMSSIVLRREEWNRVGYDHDFDGTAYALASSLLSFIRRRCRLKYIRSPLVFWRSENESFQDAGGLVKRFLIDFDGYLKLADKYLANDLIARASFLEVMTREHPWYTIINVTSHIDQPEVWVQFKDKMLRFGYSPAMAAACYFLGRNKGLVSVGVTMKRKMVKSPLVNKLARICR